MELMAKDLQGNRHTANVMVYIRPYTNKFCLSRDGCIKLGIINTDFPRIGKTMESCAVREDFKTCDCIPWIETLD